MAFFSPLRGRVKSACVHTHVVCTERGSQRDLAKSVTTRASFVSQKNKNRRASSQSTIAVRAIRRRARIHSKEGSRAAHIVEKPWKIVAQNCFTTGHTDVVQYHGVYRRSSFLSSTCRSKNLSIDNRRTLEKNGENRLLTTCSHPTAYDRVERDDDYCSEIRLTLKNRHY